MATHIDKTRLDLDEQIMRIEQIIADTQRKKQESRLAPIALALSALTAGAAIFAAGAAFAKIFFP